MSAGWVFAASAAFLALLAVTAGRFEAVANERGYIFLHDRIFGRHQVCFPETNGVRCLGLAGALEGGGSGAFDDLVPNQPVR